MTTAFTPTAKPFLEHLHVHKTAHVILTAETEDFDEVTLRDWRQEGFVTHYVPLGRGGTEYIRRLHAFADDAVGISEQYAIVAFGDAAASCLENHQHSVPRLCALVAYYPSSIPEPIKTHFPLQISVLIHLVGREVGVNKTPEVLGIQGKRKTIMRRVGQGNGLGGTIDLEFAPVYTYEGAESGFAEHDLDEYNEVATDLAWTRTLYVVKRAFGMDPGLEKLRDEHYELAARDAEKAVAMMDPDAQVFHTPTMTGGIGSEDLESFYAEYFSPSPMMLNAKLLSRTIGVDRVVDEMNLNFKHNKEIDWLLPGIPPTNKHIEITLVSIVCIKGGKLLSEHIYWDQASVLVQAGLLDPKAVPQKLKKEGVEKLPVVGVEGARTVLKGDSRNMNGLIPDW